MDEIFLALGESLKAKLPITEQEVMRQLAALLSDPLESCELSTMLAVKSFPQVIALLDASSKKEVALGIIQTLLKNRSTLSSVEEVELLYNFIDCVVIGDVDEDGADDKEKSAQLANEQNVVAKVAHLIKAPEDDYEHQLEMLNVAYDALLRGGARRIRYTFPSLVFAASRAAETSFSPSEPKSPTRTRIPAMKTACPRTRPRKIRSR